MKHEQLCEGCPNEILQYMKYCRALEFTQRPDYAYLNKLLTSLAEKEGVNLHNKRFDWSIKAVALQKYPSFFDWIKNSDINPLDKKGQFKFAYSRFEEEIMEQEKQIYELACKFKFSDTRELKRLVRCEKMRHIREPQRQTLEFQLE